MSRALRRVRPTGFSNRACSGHTHTAMDGQRMVAANLTTSSGVIWMNTQEAAIAAPVTPHDQPEARGLDEVGAERIGEPAGHMSFTRTERASVS